MRKLVVKILLHLKTWFSGLSALDWKSFIKLGGLIVLTLYVFIYINLKRQPSVFNYTHLPDELIKQGFTETYVSNQINHISRAITEFDPEERREERTQVADRKNRMRKLANAFSTDQMEAIQHLDVGGVSIKALIVITDKIVSLVGFDVDNNLSLEFTKSGDSILQLVVALAGKRAVFQEPYSLPRAHQAVALLNYQAAKFILQHRDPAILISYLYNIGESEQCVEACVNVLKDPKSELEAADAFGYLGLTGYLSFDSALNSAKRLEGSRGAWRNLSNWESAIGWSFPHMDSLIRIEPQNFQLNFIRFTSKLLDDQGYYPTSELNQYLTHIDQNLHDFSPTFRYYYALRMTDWAVESNDYHWMDSSNMQYKKAILCELAEHPGGHVDYALVANCYNNMAYNYERMFTREVFTNCSLTSSYEKVDSLSMLLNDCGSYAKMAVKMNPRNKWAHSTLAEYYGLIYMLNRDASFLRKFEDHLARAIALGYEITSWEAPYCLLQKIEHAKSKKLLDSVVPQEGPVAELMQLNVIADN